MTIQIFQIPKYLNFRCCKQSLQDSFTPKISSKKALGRQMTNDMFSCIGDWRFDWAVVTWTAMLLSLDRVHVQHVHAVLHGVVGVVVPGCPHHPRLPIELTKLREELRVEIHSAGCCLCCGGQGELIWHWHSWGWSRRYWWRRKHGASLNIWLQYVRDNEKQRLRLKACAET